MNSTTTTTTKEKTLKEKIFDISQIQHEIFTDDLELLKLQVICYDYVIKNLTKELKKDKENQDPELILDLKKQEEILPRHMLKTLKQIEDDCTSELWLNEKYGDDLLLGSVKNTTLIKQRISKYRQNVYRHNYKNEQIKKYCGRLIIRINSLAFIKIEVSDLDRVNLNNGRLIR